jgi:heat-inducible transcriptional repressor
MTYEEAIAYIHGMYWRGSKLGLVRVTELCELLGNPQNKLKFIQLSAMGAGKLLAVIVLNGNIVKNNILDIGSDIGQEALSRLNFCLNNNLNGLSIEEINLPLITKIKDEAGENADAAAAVLDAVAAAFDKEDSMPVYTSGATNIFKYPELADNEKISNLINVLEEKKELGTALGVVSPNGSKQDIQVYIGDEVPVESMKDCSVVTATYQMGDGVQGKIGIIGPRRMDYQKVVETLKATMNQLDGIFKKPEE